LRIASGCFTFYIWALSLVEVQDSIADGYNWVARVIAEVCNLMAAILCTIGAAVGAVAMVLSEPTFVNQLAAMGSAIGVLGGIAWIVAAAIAVRQRL